MILPLTLEEIKSIHDAYTDFISKNGSHVDLNSIESKIEEGIKLIREKTGNDCKVFTRLSSRSPKGGLISDCIFESIPSSSIWTKILFVNLTIYWVKTNFVHLYLENGTKFKKLLRLIHLCWTAEWKFDMNFELLVVKMILAYLMHCPSFFCVVLS